jgi:uncharacterized cupredoxin-like copper-binding protein
LDTLAIEPLLNLKKGKPMTFKLILTTLSVALISSTVFAAGNHAGGHADSEAIGKPGKATNAKRAVKVEMLDTMRFNPQSITVKQGETVKFIVKNSGKAKHEMVLGTEKELKEHAEVMKKNPGMEHDDDNQITVQPGKSAEIIWQFTKSGNVNFACLQPGHFEAGMKGVVVVGGKSVGDSPAHDSAHKH